MDRLPPHSIEAEQGVLGSILLDPLAGLPASQAILPSLQAFYDLRHQTIYKTMLEMVMDGQPVDTLTLKQRLTDQQQLEPIGGVAYLSSLPERTPGQSNLSHYAAIVRQKFLLRRIISTCTDAASRAYESGEDPNAILYDIEKLAATLQHAGAIEVLPARQMVRDVMDNLEKLHQGDSGGIPTGFADLDQITGGMRAGEYWIIAGRPSMGKSSLARQIIDHCAVEQSIPCGIFSLEENALMFGHNMLHTRARVNNRAAQRKLLAPADFQKLTVAAAKLASAPFELCTKSDLSIGEIRSVARQMKARIGARVFEVDYLQLASSQTRNGENREREMAQVSNGLKNMAKELDAVVIATCQLNRKGDSPGDIPKMEWLRESGQIEADADFIGALYYPEAKCSQAVNLYVLKQRYGPRFVDIRLVLLKEFTRFERASKVDEQDVPEQRNFHPD